MRIKIGFDLAFGVSVPTPMLLMLFVHPSRQGDLESFEQLTLERSDARTALKDATAAIDAALTEGMNAATELDVILTNTLHANTPLLALWKSARHVKRIPRKKAASAKAGSESSEG